MESKKGKKAEPFESRDIKRRKLAEGDREYRRRKKRLSKDLVIKIKERENH